ncbi:MAG: 50S ribosomal protein L25 [Candidatus Vogelbacteria bacterium]
MFTLEAKERTIFGKELKKERRAGRLPVVVYGHKDKPTSLFVSLADFKKVLKLAGESSIITLTTPAGKKSVLIHEVAYHPVNSELVHADLYVIEQDVMLKIKIPIEYTGLAPAVKELGGILLKVLHELEIEALPKDLPRGITVDVTPLATLESQILVKDLVLPAGVTTTHKPDEVVAGISVAKEEVEEEAPVDLSAIEVEKRGKEPVVGEDGKVVEEPM